MKTVKIWGFALFFLLALSSGLTQAADLKILLPMERTAYQTNERIDLAVMRTSPEALPADDLTLTLASDDGSRLSFIFPASAVSVAGNDARSTEHFYLNGYLLRPGHYQITASVNGAEASTVIDLTSHIRKSPFKLIAWGSTAKGTEQQAMGEDSLGFNLMLGHARGDDSILGGIDWMQLCTQGGGFQMDLRGECDFSDPYVIRGASSRLAQAAFMERRTPNAIGVHFHDEPQLIRHVDSVTGERTLHNVPEQVRAYRAAFGRDPIKYYEVDPNDPEDCRQWAQWCRWRLGFMEAYNTLGDFALTSVRPDYLSVTQSEFAWSWCTFANGHYFNIDRGLPVVCGHGGYSHNWAGYFNPSLFLEMIRARNYAKPNWYLPTWFHMGPDQFRMEQYQSFITNIKGMSAPPWITFHKPSTAPATAGLVESNKLMMRLGTIFTTMPVTRQPVALLHSLSQDIYAQTRNMNENRGGGHIDRLMIAYLAGKAIHNPFMTILDEDVVDGTLAANHKAVVLAGIDYLAPKVKAGLESFAASGGLVLITAESKIEIDGAVKLSAFAHHVVKTQMLQAQKEGKVQNVPNLDTIGWLMKSAKILGEDIDKHLMAAGIKPVYDCEDSGIVASRQAQGDIEYLFAVNATYDFDRGTWNAFKNTSTAISIPDDGRPVYDAVLSHYAEEFQPNGDKLTAALRFGPGEMKVFARTARPIGSVQAILPVVHKDLTQKQSPITVKIAATLLDNNGRILCGSAPLQIKVIDPLGVVRYDLYRATSQGMFTEYLPLAANDPAGEWTVLVQELLAGTQDTARFSWQPAPSCGAVAGEPQRAIIFGNDRQKVYQFFRTHRKITIVKGTEAHAEAADRLVEILKPWDVQCDVVMAADVNQPRTLTEEEARTWVGLQFAGSGQIKPGDGNSPQHVWFALREPAILLGTPENNPLIEFLSRNNFLPYRPQNDVFPGRGRGMIAWQRDGIGPEQESITLIAYDKEGMAQAVGSLYEAMAGLNSLTPWKMPLKNMLTAATTAPELPSRAKVLWQKDFPDRVAGVKPLANGRVAVLSEDGTLAAVDQTGRIVWQITIDDGGQKWMLDTPRDGGFVAVGASKHVAAFDQNGKRLWDAPLPDNRVAQYLAVSPDGSRVAICDDHARVWAFDESGQKVWDVFVGTAGDRAIINYTGDDARGAFANKLSAAFSTDSRTLAVVGLDRGVLLNAADGSEKVVVADGLNCSVAPVPVGDQLIANMADNAAVSVSAADGTITSKAKLPGALVAAAQTPAGLVIGTESDWTIRCVTAVTDNAVQNPAWSNTAPKRIIKQMAAGDNLLAVSYWGGTLRIFDTSGTLLHQQSFVQDITGMDWAGSKLVVALANGQVLGLESK